MSRSSTRWLALLVVFSACVPYLPTIDDYFTQDDFGVVQLLAGKPWTTFPRWFTMPWMEDIWGYTPDEIRPFVALTYQITALPGAARPELHHIVNILMHAANSLLVMALARIAVRLSIPAAAFAGVIFALLPVHTESVAWITGRVDSMPAFFYLATFLAYVQWRDGASVNWPVTIDGTRWYALALALFFVALFSKQNTITMVATLAVYDLLVVDRSRRGSLLSCIKAWLPFALMTLGYLALRRALFGASVRGGIESRHQLVAVGEMIERHLSRTVFGHPGPIASGEIAALFIVSAAIVVFLVRNPGYIRHALCFGVAWWAIGVAPVLVAGYESPRHVYLAAAAWAFLLGMYYEANHRPVQYRSPALRAAPVAFGLAVALFYATRLHTDVQTWGSWARVSRVAVEHVSREAATVPEGTLLLVSVPRKSWEWATPFALRPPYSSSDVAERVNLVTPFRLHCCGPDQWNVFTRERLAAWSETDASIVAIHVADTGVVSRATDAERPELRTVVKILGGTTSWQALDNAVVRLLEQLVRQP